MAGGRPVEYDPAKHVPAVIEYLKGGQNKRGAAAKMGICFTTLYDWMQKYPEFSYAVQHGLQLGEAAEIERMRAYSVSDKDGPKMNAQIQALLMRNIYGWDKSEDTEKTKVEVKLSYDPKSVKVDE